MVNQAGVICRYDGRDELYVPGRNDIDRMAAYLRHQLDRNLNYHHPGCNGVAGEMCCINNTRLKELDLRTLLCKVNYLVKFALQHKLFFDKEFLRYIGISIYIGELYGSLLSVFSKEHDVVYQECFLVCLKHYPGKHPLEVFTQRDQN